MRNLFILIIAWVCLSQSAYPQPKANVLERSVTLSCQHISLAQALEIIQEKYAIHFSYVNNVIPLQRKVSVNIQNAPLREALDLILRETDVSYQVVGKQIVLKNEPKKKVNASETTVQVPKRSSIRPLAGAGPKMIETDVAPIESDLLVPSYREMRQARRSRVNLTRYIEKLQEFMVASSNKHYLPVEQPPVTPVDSLLASPKRTKKDTASSVTPLQITIVTPLGTNGVASPDIVNNFSINIFAGYNGGLEGIEWGGFVNVIKGNVRGAQFAGFTNIVHRDVTGAQFAGFANVNGGFTRGAQFAGFANVVGKDSHVAQFAGFANYANGKSVGAQFAGFANVNKGAIAGPQLAGFANVALGDAKAPQLAGFINVAKGDVKGAQIAGFSNVATGEVEGVQLSGFFNYARKVKGSQIGFINVADSVSGASIGFLSIVRHGYHKAEIWGGEALFANMGFKLGTRAFYNIFALGAQPARDKFRWGFGYGIGTEAKLSSGLVANLDAIAYHISENDIWTNHLNLLNQLKATLGVRLFQKTFLFAGPTFNVHVSQLFDEEGQQYGSALAPWYFYNHTDNGTNVKMWIGFHGGLRF